MMSRQHRAFVWLAVAGLLCGLAGWLASVQPMTPGLLGLGGLTLLSDVLAADVAVATISAAPGLGALLALQGTSALALFLLLLGPALRVAWARGRGWQEACCELVGRGFLLSAILYSGRRFPTVPSPTWLLWLPLAEIVVFLGQQSLEPVPGERRRWRRARQRWLWHQLGVWGLVPLAWVLLERGGFWVCILLGPLWFVRRCLLLESAARVSAPIAAGAEQSRSLSQALGRQQSQLQLQNRRQMMFWELSHRLSLAQQSPEVATQGLDYLQLRLHVDQAVVLEAGQPLARIPQGLSSWPTDGYEAPREGLCQWVCALGPGRQLVGIRRDPLSVEEAVLLQDLSGLLAMAFQATDRLAATRRLMSSLVHSSTIAAVGQLAAGMAHELNSPLAAVQLQLDLASRRSQGVEGVLQPLDSARQSVHTCRELLKKLTYYSRDGSQTRHDLQLNTLVEDSLLLLGGREHWQLALGSLPPVVGNPGELQQALFHLFQNAREASPQGPWRITTAALNQRVRLTVEDLGPGLDEVVQQRMFEPFFTTRTIGENRGLGLTVARQIVEHHRGRIGGQNREGGPGASFWIELPLQP